MQKVASSFFNDAADISIEALRVVTDVLEAAPLVGVGEAARVLLTIWQGVQAVEVCYEFKFSLLLLNCINEDKQAVMPAFDGTLCHHTLQRPFRSQCRRNRCGRPPSRTYE